MTIDIHTMQGDRLRYVTTQMGITDAAYIQAAAFAGATACRTVLLWKGRSLPFNTSWLTIDADGDVIHLQLVLQTRGGGDASPPNARQGRLM